MQERLPPQKRNGDKELQVNLYYNEKKLSQSIKLKLKLQ